VRLPRREFLRRGAAGLLGCSAASSPRQGWLGARERLVVAEGNELQRMLAPSLDLLGGFDAAVRGKRVALKPNATDFQPYPVTTDPLLLQLLIAELKCRGAAEITICDAPSYAGITASRVFSKLGYYDLGKQPGVRVLCCDPVRGSQYARVSRPEWRRNPVLLTNRYVREASLVINLAIPKRHHAADFSCALKNNFGCTADTFRTLAHAHEQESFFDESLVEFADAVRPELTIVDARKLLTKSGPAFTPGKSEITDADQLIVSGDMVATDAYCAQLMERLDKTFAVDRRVKAQLAYARTLGLGDPDRLPAAVRT
jgi:uncharacterized protein (DUF362 family)